MKKSNLQTGMIIKTRAGQAALVVKDNCYGQDAVIFGKGNWTTLDAFDENLLWNNVVGRTEFSKTVDIMEVYKPHLPCNFLSLDNLYDEHWGDFKCIWKRVEKPSIQIEYLEDRTVITIFKNKLQCKL